MNKEDSLNTENYWDLNHESFREINYTNTRRKIPESAVETRWVRKVCLLMKAVRIHWITEYVLWVWFSNKYFINLENEIVQIIINCLNSVKHVFYNFFLIQLQEFEFIFVIDNLF